jgi:hypothetical protein
MSWQSLSLISVRPILILRGQIDPIGSHRRHLRGEFSADLLSRAFHNALNFTERIRAALASRPITVRTVVRCPLGNEKERPPLVAWQRPLLRTNRTPRDYGPAVRGSSVTLAANCDCVGDHNCDE